MSKFQERLRELRGSSLQDEFAAKIGISRTSLSYYENGNRIPDIDTLTRIHEVTGVSIYYLLGLTDSKDDALVTAQRDTGLSEKSLLHFANNPISAKVINHIVSCGAMKSFSDRAAILHDDALLISDFSQHEWSDVAKAMRDNSFFDIEKQLHALLSAILIDDAYRSEPFGVDSEELPSVRIKNIVQDTKKIYDSLDKLSEIYPDAKEVKNEYAKILDKMISRKEGPNG